MMSLFDEGAPPPPPARFNLARFAVADPAARGPKRRALVLSTDEDRPETARALSFDDLDRLVRAAATGFWAQGLRPGARVMLRLGNSLDFPVAFFGAAAAGLVPVATSSALSEPEARFIAEDSGAALILCDEDLRIAPPPGTPLLSPAALAGHAPGEIADTAADDPGFMVYTSGSTGRPKGVIHAHRAAWARLMMRADWHGLGPHDLTLHAGAFNWTYTLGVGLIDSWSAGAAAIIHMGPRGPLTWGRLARAFHPTLFAAVPGVYRQILKYDPDPGAAFASLTRALTAGERLSPEIMAEWTERVGKPLYEALGMSEISTYVSSSAHHPPRPGAAGRPQTGRRVAILPDGGCDPVARGETGILAVRRDDPGLMLGYWRRPDEEGAAFRGEWFLTGDRARMDGEGYIHYEGRADDLMNAFGYRVSPQEVEAALMSHPGVLEAAAAETPVAAGVSVITGFIVARPGAALTAEALEAHCAQRLAPYKRPRRYVFLEALPRSANGKLARRALLQH